MYVYRYGIVSVPNNVQWQTVLDFYRLNRVEWKTISLFIARVSPGRKKQSSCSPTISRFIPAPRWIGISSIDKRLSHVMKVNPAFASYDPNTFLNYPQTRIYKIIYTLRNIERSKRTSCEELGCIRISRIQCKDYHNFLQIKIVQFIDLGNTFRDLLKSELWTVFPIITIEDIIL